MNLEEQRAATLKAAQEIVDGAGVDAETAQRLTEVISALVERTDLPMAQVAHAAGFASIRSFNDTVAATYAMNPTAVRGRRGRGGRPCRR